MRLSPELLAEAMDDFDGSRSSFYDVALVCLNGHTVNASSRTSPEFNKKFCDKCGEKSIGACPTCQTPIQGQYKSPDYIVIGVGPDAPPGFCHDCGKPFPWTERRLTAAKDVADELEISSEDKEALKRSLDVLVREGPGTEPAKLRFKAIMKKAGKESYEVMKTVMTDLVSETLKKSMFGG